MNRGEIAGSWYEPSSCMMVMFVDYTGETYPIPVRPGVRATCDGAEYWLGRERMTGVFDEKGQSIRSRIVEIRTPKLGELEEWHRLNSLKEPVQFEKL